MNVLLDTHAFLWLLAGDKRAPARARRMFEDPANTVTLSLASMWEMSIKVSLGKLEVPGPLQTFLAEQLAENGIQTLDIAFRHVCAVETLPFHHRDPFDRLLAAQCLEDGLPILSADPIFERYGVKRIW